MREAEAGGKGEHSYCKWKDFTFCRVEENCNVAKEGVRVQLVVKELLKRYRVLQGHGVMIGSLHMM